MKSYQPCTCGHTAGQHRHVITTIDVQVGVCLTPGCDCEWFTPLPATELSGSTCTTGRAPSSPRAPGRRVDTRDTETA